MEAKKILTYLFVNVHFFKEFICLEESTILAKEQAFLTDQRAERKMFTRSTYSLERKSAKKHQVRKEQGTIQSAKQASPASVQAIQWRMKEKMKQKI